MAAGAQAPATPRFDLVVRGGEVVDPSQNLRARRDVGARLRALGAGLRAQALAEFPEEVLEVAREVEPRFGLMVRRDARYLNWRFIETTTGLHTPLGVYDAAGDLCAYAIVQRPREGEVVGYLVDVLARDEAALAQAIEAGLAQLEQAMAAGLAQLAQLDAEYRELLAQYEAARGDAARG